MSDHNDAPSDKKKKSAWPLLIGLPLIAVIAAAAIFFTGQSPGTDDSEIGDSETDEQAETPPEGERASGAAGASDDSQSGRDSSGIEHPSLGDEDAPVVMLEFSDYQ